MGTHVLRVIHPLLCLATLSMTELASRRSYDMSGYITRPGTGDDCEDIMQMFKDLAEYHNVADQVFLTPDVLKKNEFGEEPELKCIVAEMTTSDGSGQAGSLIGFGLYRYVYSPWVGEYCFREGLYVKPEWRGKGVGNVIWAHITKEALAVGCSCTIWSVSGWNKAACDFYKHRGAVNVTETREEAWHLFRMTKADMEALATQSGL